MEYTQFDGEMEVDAFDNFVPDDGSPDEFDYLFGKTYRERRQRTKELKEEGLTGSEARQKAREEIGNTKLENLVAKAGTALKGVAKPDTGIDVMATPETNQGASQASVAPSFEEGFFEKNKTAIFIFGGVAAVGALAFAFRKQLGFK